MRIKKSNRTGGQMLIDLTPLLDVIFILLIVVVCYQTRYRDRSDEIRTEAAAVRDEAMDAQADTDAQNAVLREQLETYANLNDYVNVIEIYATYAPSDRKSRTIYIRYNDEEKQISLTSSNSARAWQECETYLAGILDGSAELPTVLTIMDERMLYRDEQKINELFGELSGRYDNLYLRNYTVSADE